MRVVVVVDVLLSLKRTYFISYIYFFVIEIKLCTVIASVSMADTECYYLFIIQCDFINLLDSHRQVNSFYMFIIKFITIERRW